MNKKWIVILPVTLLAVVSFAFILPGYQNTAPIETEQSQATVLPEDEGIHWYSVAEAIELNKTTHKKIFIDVYATWCGPCKWLAANTFVNPVIEKQLATYFIPAKFNAESNDTIFFQDKKFINQNPNAGPRQSTHDFTMYIAQTDQGIAYPTMVFLDENLAMIQPIPGALTAQQLEPILDYIGSDTYKNTPWEEYMKSYQSHITTEIKTN